LIRWVPAASNTGEINCLLLRLVPDMLVACDTLHCKLQIDLACRSHSRNDSPRCCFLASLTCPSHPSRLRAATFPPPLPQELLAMVPSPAIAVLLLFPITEATEAARKEEQGEGHACICIGGRAGTLSLPLLLLGELSLLSALQGCA
jgi:hypothetical protein